MTVRFRDNALKISTVSAGATAGVENTTVELHREPTQKMRIALGEPPRHHAIPSDVDLSAARAESELKKMMFGILDLLAKNRRLPESQRKRVALVFDIDNTLMDTRFRTVEAAKCFKWKDTFPLAAATCESVGYRPEETCARLQLEDPDAVNAFSAHFQEFFWREGNMAHDQKIECMIELAKLAQELGADLYFVTGRTSTYRDETITQLRAAGIAPIDDDHLIMKSPIRDRAGNLEPTEQFKARELRKMSRKKTTIAGFITEGSRDMSYLQQHVRHVRRYYFLDFPIDETGYEVKKERTSFLPLRFTVPSREQLMDWYREARR